MSWLFKSNQPHPESSHRNRTAIPSSPPPPPPSLSVKDDVSLIFRGVANFLAPPPSSSSSSPSSCAGESSSSSSSSQTLAGIRNDLVEIGGSFRSSFSKLASQLLKSEPDQERADGGGAVPGTTEDVVRFVKEISSRPECWTEFPLPLHNDFSLSYSQREHVLSIERLVPEFVTLRLNLCSYMNVEKFWMIYFLLVLPRLNQHDFELLSSPKIVESRDALLLKLRERKDFQAGESEKARTVDKFQLGREDSGRESILFQQNQVLTEVTNATNIEIDDMSNSDKLEDTDTDATSLTSFTKLQLEEDVSFSDLEDDRSHSSDKLSGHRETHDIRGSSPDGSSDWVQLHESSSWQKAIPLKGKDSEDESNDWLKVDKFS